MNEISLRKFAPQVKPGGLILYNRDSVPEGFVTPKNVRVICIPASEMADKLGSMKTTNIVMMGALLEETECLSPGTAMGVIEDKVKKVALLETNRKSLAAGRHFIDEHAHLEAVSQPDGYAE
jgi:Pyruvate/2-oxoacid:ferredoxin oxidoreductase gamma subunit